MRKSITSQVLMVFWLISGAALSACDKVCTYTGQDIATVHNLTGRELSISVCKTLGEKKQINVNSSQVNQVSLGTFQGTKIQGGGDALKSCSVPAEETQSAGIALSSESFNDVRLCRDDSKLEYLVVEITDVCPSGSSPQVSPQNCP